MESTQESRSEIGCCRGTSLEEWSTRAQRRASEMAARAMASARQAQRQQYPEDANALENVPS
ncbi:MAG: hypothetical protein MAG715_00330 [Methanonatronarchaeales archaeon]|nr:hypothetical protein [Methanonatronarchaeales archaeon]